MSLCRKCGGTLQGDLCHRHGPRVRAAVRVQPMVLAVRPTAKHEPWSPDTDRRVFAMIGKVCQGCVERCGDLDRCPILRARWQGDWAGEHVTREPGAPPPNLSQVCQPLPLLPAAGTQLSLF